MLLKVYKYCTTKIWRSVQKELRRGKYTFLEKVSKENFFPKFTNPTVATETKVEQKVETKQSELG